jgi:enoyl-CoA hydratase/carnithine racemase
VSESELLVERDGPVATVTFNRPALRNALNLRVLEGLRDFFGRAAEEAGLRAIVLRGAGGRAFSAGSDYNDLRLVQERGVLLSGPDDPFERALAAVRDCPLPIVAMIEGFAVGGGCTLAAVCDLRLAGESAQLGMPPARLGLLYSQNGLQPFLDLLGPGRTKLLFYSGRLFSARRALELGLVDEVLPDERLEAETYALAGEIAANAPLSIRNTKRVLAHLTRRPLGPEALAEIEDLVRETQASGDFQEGQRAFFEKRRPTFEGR